MLRVLVRDSQSSRGYNTGYDDKEAGVSGTHSRFVTITSSRPAPPGSDLELHKMGDDRSDRSILRENEQHPQTKNAIMQVTDISVKYEEGERGEESGTDVAKPEKAFQGNCS